MRTIGIVMLVISLVGLALMAQSALPGQMTLKPLATSSGCVADTTGDVLCAASDGFYVSVAGGTFQKVATGTPTLPSSITCTTASLSTGSTGSFTATGCH